MVELEIVNVTLMSLRIAEDLMRMMMTKCVWETTSQEDLRDQSAQLREVVPPGTTGCPTLLGASGGTEQSCLGVQSAAGRCPREADLSPAGKQGPSSPITGGMQVTSQECCGTLGNGIAQ